MLFTPVSGTGQALAPALSPVSSTGQALKGEGVNGSDTLRERGYMGTPRSADSDSGQDRGHHVLKVGEQMGVRQVLV